MTLRKLCIAVVRIAASRWPQPEERRREWTAELHELARHPDHRRLMARFTAGIAVSRPGTGAQTSLFHRGFWIDPPMWLMGPALTLAASWVIYASDRASTIAVMTAGLSAAWCCVGVLLGRRRTRRGFAAALHACGAVPVAVVCALAITIAHDHNAVMLIPWLVTWAGFAIGYVAATVRASRSPESHDGAR